MHVQYHTYSDQSIVLVRKDSAEQIECTWRSQNEHTTITLSPEEAQHLAEMLITTITSKPMPEDWE